VLLELGSELRRRIHGASVDLLTAGYSRSVTFTPSTVQAAGSYTDGRDCTTTTDALSAMPGAFRRSGPQPMIMISIDRDLDDRDVLVSIDRDLDDRDVLVSMIVISMIVIVVLVTEGRRPAERAARVRRT
jgi:hypothetical protein